MKLLLSIDDNPSRRRKVSGTNLPIVDSVIRVTEGKDTVQVRIVAVVSHIEGGLIYQSETVRRP